MLESVKQMLGLQERDLELDKIQVELAAIPKEISAIQKQMAAEKTALEDSKKELLQFQLKRKEKEGELATQEEAVRKHTGELNAIKSNDAYRAMIGEIEKAKQEKSVLEDEILQLMDKVDQAQRAYKEREGAAQGIAGERQKQISDWEAKQKSVQDALAQKQKERAEIGAALPKAVFDRYERQRGGKQRGAVVVPLKNGQCSGCHMQVSPNLVNEAKRAQNLMACEHCSRIVYLEEVAAK